jgi:TorA maturation chaperone TorD
MDDPRPAPGDAAPGVPSGGSDPLIAAELAEALADDFDTLALLHDRELSADVIAGLQDVAFPDNLGFRPGGERVAEALRAMQRGMRWLPPAPTPRLLDDLAADYAAIYLNGSIGVSPCESVWVSDDRLACQDAMFQLRDIYIARGLRPADPRRRFDDHLVLQLQFVACAVRDARTVDDWRYLASVLDDHLLRWLGDFARCVDQRCDTPFYAGLALLTAAHVEELRDVLAARLGEQRPSRETVDARCRVRQQPDCASATYLPGASGPSW